MTVAAIHTVLIDRSRALSRSISPPDNTQMAENAEASAHHCQSGTINCKATASPSISKPAPTAHSQTGLGTNGWGRRVLVCIARLIAWCQFARLTLLR